MGRFPSTIAILAGGVLAAAAARGHDMFLVLPDHDLPANSLVKVDLYNGTFDKSENAIARDRMIDVSIVDGAGGVTHPDASAWREEGEVTVLSFKTGGPGTYVVGVSTKARTLELSAEDFNEYLEHDGVLDVLESRKVAGTLDRAATERYSKHVKTILQVAGAPSDTYAHRLGYPIEIVPLANPAALAVGEALEILVLAGGEPVAGQLVYASHEAFESPGGSEAQREAVETRTGDSGRASIPISRPGRWYVRLIRMVPVEEDGVDYESNWATLTFEVRSSDP